MGNHRRFQMSSDVIGFAPRNAASGCRAETGSEEGGNGEQQTGGEKHVAVQKRARLGEAGLQAAARSTHPDSLLLVSSQPPNCSSSRPSLPLPEPGQTFCDLPGSGQGWRLGAEEEKRENRAQCGEEQSCFPKGRALALLSVGHQASEDARGPLGGEPWAAAFPFADCLTFTAFLPQEMTLHLRFCRHSVSGMAE